ncbi:hypothetical protein M408DRAFT_326716 [Serendipita vermifera MAFF 305830]|uniref:FAD dependent oxidoreductase domain-containing protein n=1 Tax=Serendipita vermifera MAFF 305830 TaxID=933852 RepID=A0A0C3BNM9_SERVB|nr:hypothetical protein M408DRAFT_326716 [Serendipita vermifera MAFF 305830]
MTTVTILGAGVIGLSTALELQKHGCKVTIVAECMPGDEKSIRYTSPWAGAHHVTFAGKDKRQLKMDQETFHKLWQMSGAEETQHLFLRLDQTEYYVEERTEESILNFYPTYQDVNQESLPSYAKSGSNFQTLTIDVPNYLIYLLDTFKQNGGNVVRSSVQHISQLLDGGFGTPDPSAVIICAGIGARSLGGLEDTAVFPIRGQTILMRTPWIKFGRTCSSKEGLWTYIIPRRSGDVIVGGTKIDNDWYPHPRPEITEDILKRGLQLCPELVPEEIRAQREPTIEDLKPLIIEEGCGLRPGRVGGIRLESVQMAKRDGSKIPVVFNYGHSGQGYQSSWGSANIAADLLIAAQKGVYAIAK